MTRTLLLAFALLCAGPALAQQQGDFDLPETATPTPAPSGDGPVQGPVDDSGIVPIGPRVIGPTATPSATPTAVPTARPRVMPTATPTPATIQRAPAPRPSAAQSAREPVRSTSPELQPGPPVRGAATPAQSSDGPSITDPIGSDTGASTAAINAPTLPTTSGPTPSGPIEAQSGPSAPSTPFWWWIIAALAAAAVLAASAFVIRRKQAQAPIVVAPKVSPGLMPAAAPKSSPESDAIPKEMPSPAFVPATAAPQGVPVAKPSPAASRPIAPLGLETQVIRMQRSLRAITVTAQVTVTNRGSQPIANAALQGDLVGASSNTPLGQQLANAAAELAELEALGTLEPGERREATLQVRKELPEIEGIRQGNTVVFIPLVRIRFAGDGVTPLASTVLVGHPPERSGGKPTPFLADAPPQNYDNVVGRALG